MKMPEKLSSELLAPCGINCISCEKYKNPCSGCLISDNGKSKSSLKCKIKSCYDSKKFKYCGRCSEFPCPLMKKHSKKYIKRYGLNTLESGKRIKFTGIGKILEEDMKKWTCPQCGGVITFKNNCCSECNFKKEKKS